MNASLSMTIRLPTPPSSPGMPQESGGYTPRTPRGSAPARSNCDRASTELGAVLRKMRMRPKSMQNPMTARPPRLVINPAGTRKNNCRQPAKVIDADQSAMRTSEKVSNSTP